MQKELRADVDEGEEGENVERDEGDVDEGEEGENVERYKGR